MKNINSVYLKGKIINIHNFDTRNYIKIKVLSGKRKNKVIPAIIYYNNSKEKTKCLLELKLGSFISIRGSIISINNNNIINKEDCILIESYKMIPYVAYSNSFEGLITGVSNVHQNPIGKGICCNIHVKTDSSLTFPAIAFGHVVEKLMRLKNTNGNKIARGHISMNKYNRICIYVESLSSV